MCSRSKHFGCVVPVGTAALREGTGAEKSDGEGEGLLARRDPREPEEHTLRL